MTDLECPQCHHAWRAVVGSYEAFLHCPSCGLEAAVAVFVGLASLHARGMRSPWEVADAGRGAEGGQ